MSKWKQPEEPSIDSITVTEEVPVVDLVAEPSEPTVVRRWTIGEDSTGDEEEEPILMEDIELEKEEGWEAEAFWYLLIRAGYVRW